MGLVLEGLMPLYRQMQQNDQLRTRFPYRHGRVAFDVFFLADDKPGVLLFGAKAYNVAFELAVQQVNEAWEVDTYIPEPHYKALCKALGLEFNPANPFSPRGFLQDFGKALPSHLPPGSKAKPHDLLAYRRDVEDADQIYFCGWSDNNRRRRNVRECNLHKTKCAFGDKVYELCRRNNLSTCWTDDASLAIEMVIPE